MRFDWDPAKARENLRKHAVSFHEAESAFEDDEALVLLDPDHTADEERFILLGMSSTARLLTVMHTYDADSEAIRIISARRASPLERAQYGWLRTR